MSRLSAISVVCFRLRCGGGHCCSPHAIPPFSHGRRHDLLPLIGPPGWRFSGGFSSSPNDFRTKSSKGNKSLFLLDIRRAVYNFLSTHYRIVRPKSELEEITTWGEIAEDCNDADLVGDRELAPRHYILPLGLSYVFMVVSLRI